MAANIGLLPGFLIFTCDCTTVLKHAELAADDETPRLAADDDDGGHEEAHFSETSPDFHVLFLQVSEAQLALRATYKVPRYTYIGQYVGA
jgi:hypothetical protein